VNIMTSEPAKPSVSVVIPVFNGGAGLEKCLAAVYASSYPVLECILVDDASTDGMVNPAAERYGARVVRLDNQLGPAKARNRGVTEARGDIIFFTDADVVLHPDALELAVQALQSDPELGAVFGSYDDQPGHESFISQYRNLLHHWTHQTSNTEASTFWTGCGAIHRRIFMDLDGFSQDYQRPSIEDIELGMRLRQAGYRIRLLKNMLGKHLKQWTFWNMLYTDIFHRGVPWTLLVLRSGQMTSDLNLNRKSRFATIIAGLFVLSLLIVLLTGHAMALLPTVALLLALGSCSRLLDPTGKRSEKILLVIAMTILVALLCYWLVLDPWALVPLSLILAIVATQFSFFSYVARKRNMAFAASMVPMQLVFFLCCAAAVPFALFRHHMYERKATGRASQSVDLE